MRRRPALLATSAALALSAAVVTAAPAEARNIGGIGGACTSSPGPFLGSPGSNGAGQGAYCLCVVESNTGQVLAGVTGPGSKCPPGILSLQGGKR
jgi:hypothetical protein